MRRQRKHFSRNLGSLASLGFWFWIILTSAQTAQASVLSDLAASMAPGTWAEIATTNMAPSLANVSGASGIILYYSDDMVWNPSTQQAFFIGADHLAPQGPQFVSYTASTSSWQRLARPSWLASGTFYHGYDHTAIDQANQVLYHRPYGSNTAHRYNIATQTWTSLPALPTTCSSCFDALEYFPELEGLVWVRATGEVFLYRESSNQWTLLASLGSTFGGGTWTFGEYNPVQKVLVFGSGNSGTLYKLSSSGQITRLQNLPIPIYDGNGAGGVFTVDPVSGTYLMLTPSSRNLYVYNVTTDTWQSQTSSNKPNLSTRGVVATPINSYGVTFFASCLINDCHAYLYKHAAGTGTPPPATPNVAISASPRSVISGNASALIWNSTNASSCSASGGWSGAKSLSGSQSTGNLSATTNFTLTCTGVGGSVSQSATVTTTTSTPPPTGSSTLLVNFGKTSAFNTFGLSGWSTVIKDIYTDYQDVGPGGTTIVVGDNYTYNYQGVTGTSRSFLAGDKINATWYNNSSTAITFTPNISFTDPDRINIGAAGTWYSMSSITIPPLATAISEYTFTPGSAGSYSLVNVNVNYTNTKVIVADKIELIMVGSTTPPPTAPTVLLSVNPSSIASGNSSTLTWTTTNATSCTASGAWFGTKAVSGSQSTGTLTANTTYILTCTGTGGSANQSTTVAVTASSPPPSGTADFQARCATPGVVRCVGFDQASDIAGGYGSNSGIFTGATTPTLDSSVKASGSSAIKFTIPSNSAADTSGSYFTNFSTDLSDRFGQNSEFYVQWRQRFSPEFLSTIYQGGGGWKQAIIGTGDKPGSWYNSCTTLETVTQNTLHRGFAQMYNSCTGSASHGPYQPFEQPFGAFDFKLQNGQPAPYCLYSQGQTNPKTYLPLSGNCFGYFPNEWMTFQVHIKTGPRVNDEFTNSFVQLWIAREGQASQLVIDWGPYNLSAGSASEDQRYGKIWLLPYNTGKSSSHSHPTAYTWYDELIIATSKIPDPTAMTPSVQPPAAPTSLTLQ